MKSMIFALACIFSASVFAQTSTTTSLPEAESPATISAEMPETTPPATRAARGIRVSAWLPNLKTSVGGAPDARIDRTFGFTAGYADLPVRRLGWIANVGLFEMTEFNRDTSGVKEQSNTLARLDANFAFALTRNLYFKAGGNVSNFMQSELRDVYEPGFGLQGGLGVQLTEKIGFEAGWIRMVQTGVDEANGQDFYTEGIDFGITGTF